jgi:hypothetical protein
MSDKGDQPPAIGHAFHEQDHTFDFAAFEKVLGQVEHRDVGFVAG